MLKRVHIKGYKSLADVEVRLEPLTVLFGPNAAGKSNFLDALQLLSRIGASRTLREAFDAPHRGKMPDPRRKPTSLGRSAHGDATCWRWRGGGSPAAIRPLRRFRR